MKQDKNTFKLLQKNKKAYFNYEVLEDLECGIALVGTEV
ncbi:SsrA-binding protein, partial [Sphaerochaeta sp. UBA5856]